MADNTAVGVAVPDVRDTFHLGVTSLQWIVAGYIVAFAGLLFTGGVIGDRYGRRKALVGGIAIFGVGATISATAVDWRGPGGRRGGPGGGGRRPRPRPPAPSPP